MVLPQLVGLKCEVCQKTIPSIVEGTFCSECDNPVHLKCQNAPRPQDVTRCPLCGADPNSAIAQEIRNTIEQNDTINRRLVCPQCLSSRGFRPYQDVGYQPQGLPPQNVFLWLIFGTPMLVFWLLGLANAGEVECLDCHYIFRPPNPVRSLGCWIALLTIMAAALTLALYLHLS